MPFLERRWRPPATAAVTFRELISRTSAFLKFSVRHWPLTWALVYLAGFGLGGLAPGPFAQPSSPVPGLDYRLVARLTTLAPALLTFLPASGILPVWLTVFAGGHAAGSLETLTRQGKQRAEADQPHSVARLRETNLSAVLRITGWPAAARNDRWRAPARILLAGKQKDPTEGDTPAPEQGVWLTGEGDPPTLGSVITGPVQLTTPPRTTVAGGFDFQKFLTGRGLDWQGRLSDWRYLPDQDPAARLGQNIFTPMRATLVDRLARVLPSEEAGLAGAVLLGIRTQDSRRASRPFSDLGLAHLFAVSGLHVGILLGIVMLPGQILGLSPLQKILPLFLLLPLYVVLTGMPGSVVRAASLGFLALASGAAGRTSQPLRLVGLLFWAGTVWDPSQNLDTGLKLSYLAAGGILAVSALTRGLKFSDHRVLGPVLTGLAVSLAAQYFTLPLVAGSFGRISLVSPLANLVAVPVFGLAVWCVVLSLILGTVWAAGAQWVGALAWLLFRTLSGLAAWISGHSAGYPLGLPPPGVGVMVIWALLTTGVVVVLFLRSKGRVSKKWTYLTVTGTVACCLWLFGPGAWEMKSPGRVTAWQFDVGQGDCGLLVFPDGWSLLIDTGGSYSFSGKSTDGPMNRTVRPFLQRNGVTRLDAVILTHGHRDHTGGAAALAEGLEVDRWLVSGRADLSLRSIADSLSISRPEAGLVLHRWGQWKVSAVYPPCSQNGNLDENDRSLVVVLSRGKQAMAVWTGDLEHEGEDLLLGLGGAPQGVQVWKAGHHGSNTSGTRPWLDRLDPDLILISCGVGNVYGHPNHGPYLSRGDTVAVARTDLQGTIVLEWDRQGRLAWYSMVTKPRQISPP